MQRSVLLAALLLAACSRPTVVPTVEPSQVVVEVAHSSSSGISAPRSAFLSIDAAAGAGVIFVVQGDHAVRRSVAIGAVTDDRVEIVSGVAAGDEVVTRGGLNLSDGDRVTAVSRAGF